jgi:pimeloyl-ACP methyl ester carboxylesterase
MHGCLRSRLATLALARLALLGACLALLGACLALLGACSSPLRPDLARLYRVSDADSTPVIIIPGLFGSKLRERASGVEVWPGSFSDVALGTYARLALPFDARTLQVLPDDLEAFDIADTVLGQDFYAPIIDTLRRYGGYVPAVPGTPAAKGERRYYILAYDWRQDNVEHARELERLIDLVRRDYGNPALRVDIVAHSMGGLIARYYLRYGPVDVLDGTPQLVTLYGTTRVRKLILLGTPNMGSVGSLHAFLSGQSIGLKRIAPETLATMPSGYELFPHPLVTWLVDNRGKAVDADLFAGETWRRYRWSVFEPEIESRLRAARGDAYAEALQRYFDFRLERGRRFMWMMSTPEPATPIRYVLFGGDCTLTPARLLLEDSGGQPVARLYPDQVTQRLPQVNYDELMLEPGDGRVTKPSLLARETLDPSAPQNEDSFLPVAYFFFLCERHDQLTNNVNFQDNLLNVLLTPNLPWESAAGPR